MKAEILTASNINIPIVEEINPYMEYDDTFTVDNELLESELEEVESEEEEDIAAWILNPQLISPVSTEEHCCMCKNVYNNFEQLKNHAQDFHKIRRRQPIPFNSFPSRSLECKICFKIFFTRSALKQHQTAYQQIPCSECGEMIVKSQLRNHQRRHVMDQVKCEICDKMIRTVGLIEELFLISV
jgi:hypothetical protein